MNTLSLEAAQVRQAMLDALGESITPASSVLRVRLRCAADLQNLWHLRGELMQTLALMHGEGRAARELNQITTLFEPNLPRGLARSVQRTQPRA